MRAVCEAAGGDLVECRAARGTEGSGCFVGLGQ